MSKKRIAWLLALIVVAGGFYYWNTTYTVTPEPIAEVIETA